LADLKREQAYVAVQFIVLGAQMLYLATRMDDCGVISTTKRAADLRQGFDREVSAQVHGDLSRTGAVPGAPRAYHLDRVDAEPSAHALLDL
jgi:hypothetical protein